MILLRIDVGIAAYVLALATASLTGLAVTQAAAADWPQWRGPQRDGISQEKGLAQQWPGDGPRLLWQIKDAGGGYSTPAVVGARLYILGNHGNDDEFVQARNVADGQPVWTQHIGKVGLPDQQPNFPGSRSTTTVDGQCLYALGSDGDIVCLETATGKEKWHKNTQTDFGGKPGRWAYSESPLVDGHALICTPGGSEATIVALDKTTGEPIWKSALPEGDEAGYASAMVALIGGVKQYIQFPQNGLVGVDAKSGRLLWRYTNTAKGSQANIPTPVVETSFVYSATGQGAGGLVDVKNTNGAFEADQVYLDAKLPNAIGGSVKVGDYLYGTTKEAIKCVDFKSGAIKWSNRGIEAASLCFAEGNLYLHGENGDVALVEANPEGYHERGRFTPPDLPEHQGWQRAWAYPVVANGRLYIRDLEHLWCYDVSAAPASN
jgi:outer membrane protein assembly factor BamB